MKREMLILIIVCVAFMTNAQITLDSANFTTTANVIDSQQFILPPKFMPERGKNINWDYSKAVVENGTYSTLSYLSPSNSYFKTATLSSIQAFPLAPNDYDSVKSTFYFTDNFSGYSQIGYSIVNRQVYWGGGDSLIFLAFDTDFAANPQYILKYPAAYDSNWAYSARLTFPIKVYINPPPSYYYGSTGFVVGKIKICGKLA